MNPEHVFNSSACEPHGMQEGDAESACYVIAVCVSMAGLRDDSVRVRVLKSGRL